MIPAIHHRVSLDDAEDVVEHEPPLDPDRVPPEIVGYRDALTYVQQLADHPHFRFERMLLSALHFMMLAHRLQASRTPASGRSPIDTIRPEQLVGFGPHRIEVHPRQAVQRAGHLGCRREPVPSSR